MQSTFFIRGVIAAALLTLSPVALAETRAIACDGCNDQAMNRAATEATNHGTVYVFNHRNGKVIRYRVFTEVIDVRPYTAWTSAVATRTDGALKRAFESFLEAARGLGHDGVIELPGAFPVRSVAGALVDPDFATTAIENYLMSLPDQQQLELTLWTLASRALDLKLPLVDLRSIVRDMTIKIVFPDGSSMDFTIEYSSNQVTLRARTELEPKGNAMAADGLPAPTSAIGFRNRRFRDADGSLVEWVALARSLGLMVSGGYGTVMECWVDGHDIHCTVRRSH